VQPRSSYCCPWSQYQPARTSHHDATVSKIVAIRGKTVETVARIGAICVRIDGTYGTRADTAIAWRISEIDVKTDAT
jgi:hypothetical protein